MGYELNPFTRKLDKVGAAATGGAGSVNFSAGTTSNNLTNVVFSNSNNVTFGLNGSTITASANAAGAGDGFNNIAAGTQTANTTGTVAFSNSNNVSFGMSNSSVVTASASFNQTVQTQGMVSVNGSTGNISLATGSSLSSSSNGSTITFGLASNITTALQSAGAYLTTAMQSNAVTLSNIKVSGGTTSNNLSAITFADGNGVSFGLNASTLTATVKTDYQSSNANYLTSQSNQALSGSNGSFNFQTATFGNLNGMSFYTSNGSMVGSYTVPTVTDYFSKTNTTFNGTNASGSITLNTNGIRLDISAGGGGANPAASASNGSFTFQTLGFSNANNVTFGTSAGSIVTASVAAPGAAAENNWFALTGANTAGNTTASGSTIGLSGINLTLSGTNGSGINISAPATSSLSATGGLSISTNGSTISIGYGKYLSRFEYPEGFFTSIGQTGQGSLSINHAYVPFNVTGTQFKIAGSLSGATNTSATTASVNNSLWIGIYTLNGSSLSLASSGSANNGFQWSQSASSTGNSSVNSMRQMTVPMDFNMTPGEYWVAAVISQQTTYTSHGFTMYGNSLINNAATGAVLTPIGSGTTANQDAMLLQGIYTAATSAGPNSIGGANINNTSASNVLRANFYWAGINATY